MLNLQGQATQDFRLHNPVERITKLVLHTKTSLHRIASTVLISYIKLTVKHRCWISSGKDFTLCHCIQNAHPTVCSQFTKYSEELCATCQQRAPNCVSGILLTCVCKVSHHSLWYVPFNLINQHILYHLIFQLSETCEQILFDGL